MALSAGTRLGPYEVLAPLGAGGMGEVYRARDTRLGREVAVKVLPAAFSADPDRLRRFEQEARAASALNHPNILTIYDVGTHDSAPYVVSEFLDGETLRERLAGATLPARKAMDYGIQIAEGLAAAHEKGIVHRDLKPENLFVTKDGRVKILDFGLAKLTQPEVASGALTEVPTATAGTEPGVVMGTVGYMSPEQVRGQRADPRSDIFAFGAILYEMLTGRRAFRGDSAIETMNAILKDEPPEISASRPGLSPALDRVVRRCLEKSPEERFQSARDLAFALQETVSGTAAAPPATALPASRSRSILWFTSLGLSLVALLVVLIATNAGGLRGRLRGRATGPRIESLAVLPLENLSHDPEQEYFADGMTEELITDLAQIRSLRVISRTSVMAYKATKKPLPQIGRELNADAILAGSVQKSGDRVRITAQLIHAATDRHLWARSYERDLRDVLSLQGEVARAVTKEIRAAVTPQEEARLAKVRPVDPEAHELYLKGRYYWNKRTESDVRRGLEFFQKAIERDPAYALAYDGLSGAWLALGFYEGLSPRETFPRAKAAATKALEIDDGLAEARAALAMVNLLFEWNWAQAESEFKKTLELNPNYPAGHHWHAEFLTAMGRHEEAVAEARRARELDPLSLIINAWVGRQLYFSRRYDEAIAECRKTLELDTNFVPAHWLLGSALVQKARYPEAVAEFQEAVRLTEGSPRYLARLGHAYAVMGKLDEARRLLDQLVELSRHRHVSSYNLAVVALGLGERDRALGWLEKAYEERSSQMCFLKVEPLWDALRPDPRFHEVLRQVGFTP